MEEIKKAIDDLREELGKNPDAQERLDAIEKAAGERDADAKKLREDIEKVREHVEEREREIKDLQQRARIVREAADPIRERHEATRMFGMMIRESLCRHVNVEIPARFRGEADEIRTYREARATLEAGAVTGSYLVPTITESDLIEAVEELSDLMGRVDFLPGLPGNVTIPVLTTRPTLQSERATVDTKATQTDPAFSRVQLTPAEAYLYFPIDNRLMQMSAVTLGPLALRLCQDGIIEGMAKWVVLADGTSGYNSLTGIVEEATYVTTMPAGKVAFGDLANAHLNSALAAMLKRGRGPNCVWLMSLFVLGILEDLNRSGKIKVIKEKDNGDVLCKRRPVVIDEDMPDESDDGADKVVLGVGDLGSYIVGLVGGIMTAASSDYLFGENQTAFRAVVNMDIKRKPVNTFRVLKTAAA